MGGRVFRHYYKGHIYKTNGEGGSKEGMGVGWCQGKQWGKMQTTVIEQQ